MDRCATTERLEYLLMKIPSHVSFHQFFMFPFCTHIQRNKPFSAALPAFWSTCSAFHYDTYWKIFFKNKCEQLQ